MHGPGMQMVRAVHPCMQASNECCIHATCKCVDAHIGEGGKDRGLDEAVDLGRGDAILVGEVGPSRQALQLEGEEVLHVGNVSRLAAHAGDDIGAASAVECLLALEAAQGIAGTVAEKWEFEARYTGMRGHNVGSCTPCMDRVQQPRLNVTPFRAGQVRTQDAWASALTRTCRC